MHRILPERKFCGHESHEVCSFEEFPSPSLVEELCNYCDVDRSVAFVPRLPKKFNGYISDSGWWCPNTYSPFPVHPYRRGSGLEPDVLSLNIPLLWTGVD